MLKSIFFFLLIITAFEKTKAQNFPLDIVPLSHPITVQATHPIKLISSSGIVNRDESSYMYSGAVKLNGIDFSLLFLYFTRNKLTRMVFGVKNKEYYDRIVKTLSSKYAKGSGCGNVNYCFQNKGMEISLSLSEEPRDKFTEYAYLTYTFTGSGEL